MKFLLVTLLAVALSLGTLIWFDQQKGVRQYETKIRELETKLEQSTARIPVLEDEIKLLNSQVQYDARLREAMNSAIRSYDLPAFDFDIGNAKVVGTIKARWQNGKLSYVFSLAPADPLLPRNGMPEALNPYFTASFVDKDGFEIVRTRFPVKEMSPESDDLIVRGEIPIDSTRAAKISSWRLSYRPRSEVDDEKAEDISRQMLLQQTNTGAAH